MIIVFIVIVCRRKLAPLCGITNATSRTGAHRSELARGIQSSTCTKTLLPIVCALDEEDLKRLLLGHVNAVSGPEIDRIHRSTSSMLDILKVDGFCVVLGFLSMYALANVCVLSKEVGGICRQYVKRWMIKERWLMNTPVFKLMFTEKWLNADSYDHWTHCSKVTLAELLPLGYGDHRVIPAGPLDPFPVLYCYANEYPVGETPKLRGVDAAVMHLCTIFRWKSMKVIYAEAQLCSDGADYYQPERCCSEVGVHEWAGIPLDEHWHAMSAGLHELSPELWRYSNIGMLPGPDPPMYKPQAFTGLAPWPWCDISDWKELYDINRGMYIVGPSVAWRRDVLRRLQKLDLD